jgi:hypothetical protein
MDFVQWLLENGNRLTVAGLLAAELAVTLIAFQKQWVVPGYVWLREKEAREKLEAKIDISAAKTEAKLDRLEQESLERHRR